MLLFYWQLFKDAWLLHMHTNPWTWQPLKVENEDHGAPELWCHPACRVRGSEIMWQSGERKVCLHGVESLDPCLGVLRDNRLTEQEVRGL